MTFQKNILTRAILATGLVAGLGLSQMALAESANDDLEITAGISAALTLECTPMSFGITRVTDTNFNATTLTLATNNNITKNAGGDEKVVPLTSGTAGTCTLSGSLGSGSPTVTYGENLEEGSAASIALEGAAFSPLDPASGNELTVVNFTEDAPAIDNDGRSIIKIGANLVIPTDAAVGGYSGTIKVTVNDGV